MAAMRSGRTDVAAADAPFGIHSATVGGRWVVHVRGDVDLASAAELERELLTPGPDASVVVDLTGVTLLTAQGIRTLLRLRRYGRPALVCPPGSIRRVLSIVRAEEAVTIHQDLASALDLDHPHGLAASPAT
jgi:anti-sigma B factor antagonist